MENYTEMKAEETQETKVVVETEPGQSNWMLVEVGVWEHRLTGERCCW